MDDLGFSLKNLFHKKKKKSAPPPPAPVPISVPLPKSASTQATEMGPALAPTEASGWMTYLPYILGGVVVLVGIIVVIRMRKSKTSPDA